MKSKFFFIGIISAAALALLSPFISLQAEKEDPVLKSAQAKKPSDSALTDFKPSTPRHKLIEFGWGEPSTSYLKENISSMERLPFDGVVFNVRFRQKKGEEAIFAHQSFGRSAITWEQLLPALEDIRSTRFNRFTDNFLRFNLKPADIDWFDDFSAPLNSATIAARFVAASQIKGLLLDLEPYDRKIFSYDVQKLKSEKSFSEYATQVRSRGREFMNALKAEDPTMTLFLTFAYEQALKKSKDPKEDPYGLLPSFLDGMLEVADSRMEIVNGYEDSYGYLEEKDFTWGYAQIKQVNTKRSAVPEKYRSLVTAGFGLWMDLDSARKGWHIRNFHKNERTPREFQTALLRAFKQSDKYVWVYTQQPQWWENKLVPEEYVWSIRQARKAFGLSNPKLEKKNPSNENSEKKKLES